MALLTRQEKKKIASPWVQKVFVDAKKTANLNLDDLDLVTQAAEDWVETNQASFVAALPEPFKTNTNAAEKTLMLVYVVMKRAGLI